MPFESPIEEMVGAILDGLGIPYYSQFGVGVSYSGGYCRYPYECEDEEGGRDGEDSKCTLRLHPDESCSWCSPVNEHPRYRLDFAVFVGEHKIAIECDGWEYHKRSEQQIQADIERDKWLRDNGWIVKRYSGALITRHRGKVKTDIKELVEKLKPKDAHDQMSLF